MAFGLEVLGDSGALQLSANHANPVLVQSGNMTTITKTAIPWAVASEARLTYTRASSAHHPLLAIRPTDATMLYFVQNTTTLTWTWVFLSNQAVGTTIPYWLFDRATPGSVSHGIELFDAAGARIFSIGAKPLRVRNMLEGTFAGATQNAVYDSGRTYAAVIGRYTEQTVYRALPDHTEVHGMGVLGIADGIRMTRLQIDELPGNDPTPWTARHLLVLDVTNY